NAPQTRAEIIEQYQMKSAELNALMWEKSNEIDAIIAKIKSVEEESEEAQTPDTLQNSEQPHHPNAWEELAQFREIGEETRRMIIAHGKISDATNIVGKVFNEEYGSDADEFLEPFYDDINDCQKKLLDLMCMLIDNNLGRKDNATI
ncbi:MAG: hypothetical protein SNG57_01725, partial [Rikenellaceae bacterium]